jgi:hypothetical protein
MVSIQQAPTAVETVQEAPEKIELFPNPASHRITITYDLKRASPLGWQITDMQGRMFLTTTPYLRQAGHHEEHIEVSHLPPGLYVIRPGGRGSGIKFSVVR